ncbi:MAG TPA: LEA type 2 family protein [Thermoanaerobaculia bacterium]|nr:LEA type 2 family protein [Thermoanaerobaculia bacterium]
MRRLTPLLALAALVLAAGCSSLSELGRVVQAPRFSQADGRPAELRVVAPSERSRAGGAAVRLWAEIENPNPFGVKLGRLDGTLFLEDTRAAASVDFPLGLELGARDLAVVPLDVTIDFDDLSAVADVVRHALDDREVGYRLEGTIGLHAGPFGAVTFGPMDVLEGELDATVLR